MKKTIFLLLQNRKYKLMLLIYITLIMINGQSMPKGVRLDEHEPFQILMKLGE